MSDKLTTHSAKATDKFQKKLEERVNAWFTRVFIVPRRYSSQRWDTGEAVYYQNLRLKVLEYLRMQDVDHLPSDEHLQILEMLAIDENKTTTLSYDDMWDVNVGAETCVQHIDWLRKRDDVENWVRYYARFRHRAVGPAPSVVAKSLLDDTTSANASMEDRTE